MANGTREEIAKRVTKVQRVRLAVQANKEAIQQALAALNVCEDIHYEGSIGSGIHRFLLRGQVGHPLIRLVDELIKDRRWPLTELTEEGTSLEEAFISLLSAGKRP